MSTNVDPLIIYSSCLVDTVSKMSTGVDKDANIYRTVVEAVRKNTTKVGFKIGGSNDLGIEARNVCWCRYREYVFYSRL